MHNFKDTLPRAKPDNIRPIEALCYAGHWLDDEILEYTTVVVKGRVGFEREITAPNRANDGALYLKSRIKNRKLEVVFKLQCETIEQYNKVVEKLNQLMYATNVEIKFADDLDYHYIGTVENITFNKPLLSTLGKIEINCSDPYKYSTPKTIIATSTSIAILNNDLTYLQTPKIIEFTPNKTIPYFEMRTNTGKVFKFNETIEAGTKLTIDFMTLTVKLGTVQHLMGLQLSSNFSDFYIKNGTIININESGNFKIIYEVKRL